jgi:cation transport ATPase
MYIGLLHLHNATRWLVLVAGVVAILIAVVGLVRGRPWTRGARLGSLAYVVSMDVQLVIGLLLYVVSPLVQAGFADPAAAMRDSTVRYFFVEHLVLMLLAVAAAHVGSVAARRARDDATKYRRTLLWFGLSFLLVLVAIPWWRPLFPGIA